MAAVEEANTQIYNRGQASTDFKGMGTTTTALALLPYGALLAHVGDSRAYRLRGNRFEQLTFDHSLVWEMRTAASSRDRFPITCPKNVITRSLGPEEVQVDLEGPHPVVPGDTSDVQRRPLRTSEGRGDGDDLVQHDAGPEVVRGAGGPGESPRRTGQHRRDRRQGRGRDLGTDVQRRVDEAGLRSIHRTLRLVRQGRSGLGEPDFAPGRGEEGTAGERQAPRPRPLFGRDLLAFGRFRQATGETLRELREAAAQAELEFDKESVNAFLDRAAAGLQNGDFVQAVRNYCQGISFLVAEFKRQGKSRPGGKRT